MSYLVSESMLDLMTTIAKLESDKVELKKRIAELEQHKNYYQDFLEVNTDCKSITELVGKYKKQSQCIVELNQQVAFEMQQKGKAREQRNKVTKRIAELEQAIMSNCYDDHSTSGKRLMALVTKGGAE